MKSLVFLSTTFGAALIVASVFFQPPLIKANHPLIAPPPHLEYLSFGFQMPMADSLWIRAIQDFDYCDNLLAKNLCVGNGWLFHMLDTITNLAPDYQIVYRTGALSLTVLVSDYEGASRIFDKGVRLYPQDKNLLYRAAYHAMVEEKNGPKAAELLIQAAKNGGNPWFYSLATRLYTEAGKKDLAQKLFEELKAQPDLEPGTLERIRKKLEEAK